MQIIYNDIYVAIFHGVNFVNFILYLVKKPMHRINDKEQLLILCSPAGSDVLKCPITCEVLKDPVVAAGKHQHCCMITS